MERWDVKLTKEAEADLDRLHPQVRARVLEKLEWLATNFDEIVSFPLGGPWRGFFKLRVSDWRIIYDVEYEIRRVTVHYIDHRDKVYKRRRV